MQFEVPQFIEVEDKIFGPLTWRQFLYLGGGLGMAVVIFLVLPFIFFVIFGIPLALLAGALAFYPVNNRPFSFFLEAIVNYFSGQRLYLWRRREDIVYKNTERTPYAPAPTAPTPTVTATPPSKNIASLARRLELQAIQKQQ
ncbi:MAG TPA: PrgI family protein [Candidatus Paceibacterota bacterium]